ncbi:hypothetical protein [Streptomyces litmocidini]|uniref:hypothetical protein n=1 Tax=Streptomyces litmocidini TaxID=67318 RepID=UPI0036FA12D3
MFVVMIPVGAVLAFASDPEFEAVDLEPVGLILMAVGFLGTAVCTTVLRRRRTTVPPVAPTVTDDRRDPSRGGTHGRCRDVHDAQRQRSDSDDRSSLVLQHGVQPPGGH